LGRLVGLLEGAVLPVGLGVAEGFGLVLRGTDDHDHVAAVDTRRGLDNAYLGDILRELLEQADAHLGTLLLTSAELDHGLDLVAGAEEADGMATLRLVVVRVDLEAEPDLLQDRVGLVLPRLAGLDGRFVLVLTKIHELGHRRLCLRCYLDKIQVGLGGKSECVLDTDDSYLFAGRSDQPHLGNADTIVDSWLANV
jgi:hypothetical protein